MHQCYTNPTDISQHPIACTCLAYASCPDFVYDILTGGGAIRTDTLTTELVTTGTQNFSLADGALGQIKIIVLKTDGGNATITPATFADATNIVLDTVLDNVTLMFSSAGWLVIAGQGFATS